MNPLEKMVHAPARWLPRSIGRLEDHLTNPFNDFREPLLSADTPDAKEKLREWMRLLINCWVPDDDDNRS
jgi:hypothetical protein